jgi:16S rRNA G966 N2-methylase RsmD
MVADDLALSIAAATVRPGARVLDPFCGSGRLLMAASSLGAQSHGFDVNPLACLITRAKATQVPSAFAAELAREAVLAARFTPQPRAPLSLRHSKVAWFSEAVATELAQIVEWLTTLRLSSAETLVAAVALSAATRDAAWIRKSGWKLHRMDEETRTAHTASAWFCLTRRLNQYARFAGNNPLTGPVEVTLGTFDGCRQPANRFDVVLTSPPYGDSKSTVQYGAASGICLDVVTRLPGLGHLYRVGGEIDRACLGSPQAEGTIPLKSFWAGAADGEPARRVTSFLLDFKRSCGHLREALAPGGTIVMVVGRRSVGGYRVRLDAYATSAMTELGLRPTDVTRRRLVGKTLPRVINRFARAADPALRSGGTVKTMDEEWILTFRDEQC